MATDPGRIGRRTARPRAMASYVGQVVSGVVLVGLVAAHIVAQHFVVPDGLRSHADVIAWLRSPVVLVVEVAFLVIVTSHALLGLRAILFDFGFSTGTERRITRGVWLVGIVTVAYGVGLLAAILNAA